MLKTHHGESIVLASNNAGKVREINALLAAEDIHVIPQDELGVAEAEETGLSFVENAILKARNAAAHSGLAAIADDSGIEVDALKGAPGIYSARFAGRGASDSHVGIPGSSNPESQSRSSGGALPCDVERPEPRHRFRGLPAVGGGRVPERCFPDDGLELQ